MTETMNGTTNGTDPIPSTSKHARTLFYAEINNHSTSQHNSAITSKSNNLAICNDTASTAKKHNKTICNDGGSIEIGKEFFANLILPLEVPLFMKEYWEKLPTCITRKRCHNFYTNLVSRNAIDKMLQQNHVEFGKDIDIHVKGKYEILTGRALPSTISKHYENGCSIIILNPQLYLPVIHLMIARLQDYLHCTIDCNIYLNSQNGDENGDENSKENGEENVAPYDDCNTFVFQVSGQRQWKIYSPKDRKYFLPTEPNVVSLIEEQESQNVVVTKKRQPYLDVVLTAGDMLYYPRGFMYQSLDIGESLHITIRLNGKQTYGELLKILLPMAIKYATETNEILRQRIPLDIWQTMGFASLTKYDRQRDVLIKEVQKIIDIALPDLDKVVDQMAEKFEQDMDDAVDQMAAKFQLDALPPKLNHVEKLHSVFGADSTTGKKITWDTKIRLLRGNIVRLVHLPHDANHLRMYYSSCNSTKSGEFGEIFLDIPLSDACAVYNLVRAYPTFIEPKELNIEDKGRNLILANQLWEIGVLMTDRLLL